MKETQAEVIPYFPAKQSKLLSKARPNQFLPGKKVSGTAKPRSTFIMAEYAVSLLTKMVKGMVSLSSLELPVNCLPKRLTLIANSMGPNPNGILMEPKSWKLK